jgi:hypothetical protein
MEDAFAFIKPRHFLLSFAILISSQAMAQTVYSGAPCYQNGLRSEGMSVTNRRHNVTLHIR